VSTSSPLILSTSAVLLTLAHAIVDPILERGRLLTLDGRSRCTKHLGLDDPTAATASPLVARISGIRAPEFPEPTLLNCC